MPASDRPECNRRDAAPAASRPAWSVPQKDAMDGSSLIQGDRTTHGGLDALLRAVLAGSNQPLARAATLPPAAYTSEAFFQLAAERIFRRDWLVIDHVSLPLALGDYFPLDLLGEMIVVASDQRLRITDRPRVCAARHRAIASQRLT